MRATGEQAIELILAGNGVKKPAVIGQAVQDKMPLAQAGAADAAKHPGRLPSNKGCGKTPHGIH